ncbi:TPA: CoA transferase [Escherichia albertii]|uniref:CoA transferase n=1 Tax=Escherichia albertii TaxID=208962 RepID=UPI00237A3A9B|nr:CoA transferase [Escherichia albertii]
MRPLEGIKVVDLTSFLAAPTVARLLGDWGADVIKIEPPTGDPGRTQLLFSTCHMRMMKIRHLIFPTPINVFCV